MFTAICALAAVWLMVAPVILGFSAASLSGSILSGLITAVLGFAQALGADRFFWAAVVGLYDVIVGFAFTGAARWSSVVTGTALVIAGLMALRAEQFQASVQHDQAD